jgi:hypothetical protein
MYRLIYKSRSKTPVDWDLVNSILETSQKQNTEIDISGVLVATRSHFLQVLEGSFEAVNDLYYKIARDPRHERVQLVSFTCTERRIFNRWEMHGIGVFNFNRELSRQLKRSFGEEDGEVRFPTEEWEALSLINEIRQVQNTENA